MLIRHIIYLTYVRHIICLMYIMKIFENLEQLVDEAGTHLFSNTRKEMS